MIPVQNQYRVFDFPILDIFIFHWEPNGKVKKNFTLRIILLRQSLSCFKPLSCLKSGTHFYIDPAWFHARPNFALTLYGFMPTRHGYISFWNIFMQFSNYAMIPVQSQYRVFDFPILNIFIFSNVKISLL